MKHNFWFARNDPLKFDKDALLQTLRVPIGIASK